MGRGGKRPGAGRKRGARALVTRSQAEGVLTTVNEGQIWRKLLHSENERIVFESMKYLTDRRDGKPIQSIAADLSLPDQLIERLKRGRERIATFRAEQEEEQAL